MQSKLPTKLSWLATLLFSSLIAQVQATPVDLARVPLLDAVAPEVRPNLMFILDNSGSMGQDYTPDYISDIFSSPADGDRNCKDGGDTDTDGNVYSGAGTGAGTGSNRYLDLCIPGDPVYMSPDMNSQYYNPELTYLPGVNADGTSKPSQTSANTSNFTAVKTDPYLKQQTNILRDSQTSTNLVSAFPDRLWCTVQNPTALQKLDTAVCRTNTDYTYPDATFKYGRTSGNPNQQVTAAMLDNVIYKFGNPYYYRVVPTEYCKDNTLRNCASYSAPTGEYVFPARSRWCDDVSLTNCQSINTTVFKFPRYIGSPSFAGAAASGSFRVNTTNTGTTTVSSVKVNGVEIMGGTGAGCGAVTISTFSTSGTTRRNLLATAIVNKINACASSPEYTAVSDGASSPRITITSTVAAGATANGTISPITVNNGGSIGSFVNVAGGVNGYSGKAPYTFTRVDITSTTTAYPKASTRSDCTGAVGPTGCSYQEEMTNFSNWYAYHRTRMQGMKTAASLAFKDIGGDFRVGFITIASQSSNYLPVKRFINGGPKEDWYTKLFSITPSSSTPLRSALSLVGRIYAGEELLGKPDPMEYACQANYALLTTDGYWNTDTDATVLGLDGAQVGNVDSGTTSAPKKEDPLNPLKNTLADVAKYFLDNDLRTSGAECTGALNEDVCGGIPDDGKEDVYEKQNMRTFTLGLGVDGTLIYSPTYKTDTTGDFAEIKADLPGGKRWPKPVENDATAIDDLWHAGVNGDGEYFSAKDTSQLVNGLKSALKAITITTGSASAASTSSLTPVQTDNSVYGPTYTTVNWTGNLIANRIDTQTGDVVSNITWCAETVAGDSCTGTVVYDPFVNGVQKAYCRTTATLVDGEPVCGQGFLQADNTTCKQEITPTCEGRLAKQLAGTGGPERKILMNVGGNLLPFTYSNLTATQKGFFSASHLGAANRLSQWTLLTATQKTKAVGSNLVEFIKGASTYEDRVTNTAEDRVFRSRTAVLGDIVGSAPEFVGAPAQIFLDPGYEAFKELKKDRRKMVYVGANDGMLHAFDADTGYEQWAFVPSEVIKHLWKLADKDYANKHDFFVNGSTSTTDVCFSSCDSTSADWHTVLVGSLARGGRGYFAIDVTDPNNPELLWEFSASESGVGDENLGYTYGRPNFTKKEDGTWVVLLTSGYNNIPENVALTPLPGEVPQGDTPYTLGDGKGYLYVVNAQTGAIISKLETNEGSVSTPSGLAQITVYADDPLRDRTAKYVYAGDLLGNLWRFDINATNPSEQVFKITSLRNEDNQVQPITVAPILGDVGDKRVIFVGTGQYLQSSDRGNEDVQTIYAIKDDGDVTISNPRAQMVKQTMETSGEFRNSTSNNPVDFSSGLGWLVDLPDPGERQNIDGALISGTLSIDTNVPTGSTCEPGGYGYENEFNYKTGSAVDQSTGLVSRRTRTQTVGSIIIKTPSGYKKIRRLSDGTYETDDVNTKIGTSGFQVRRAVWRELTPPPQE